MRRNKKGFTLIELLAVIVILAVIAIIAIPIITNVIDKAKIGAAESSVLGYIDAVEKTVVTEITKGNSVEDTEYNTSDESALISKITYKGARVTGTFTLTKKQITSGSFCVDNKSIDYDGKKAKYNKSANYCNGEVVEVLEGDPIGTVTQNLLDNNTTYGNYTYMGGTYLKGVQESNYVWYNGFLWRIMGKNEDGSVKLITEENATAIPYGNNNQVLLYSSNTGYLKDWLNEYFYNNLDKNKTSIIKDSDWCIDQYSGTYTAGTVPAITDCTDGTIINAKVGLITLYEYNLSGASSTNSTYGLVNSQWFWTLTPYSASSAWTVDYYGSAGVYDVATTGGVRPVINVDTTATITGGNGTLADAYILNQTTSNKTGKLSDNASSGEYVILNGKTYRVVCKDSSIGTKLIYDGYYEEVEGTPYVMTYGSDNTFSTSAGIGQKLNGDVLTWLGNSDKIVPTSWYQTTGFGYRTAYTTILNDISNPITETKVGLIRVGEMMSGQSASILTKNYTKRSAFGNAKYYWTMNKGTSASYAWLVYSYGRANYNVVADAFGARPVIYVNTDTTITEGNGTLQNPYIID